MKRMRGGRKGYHVLIKLAGSIMILAGLTGCRPDLGPQSSMQNVEQRDYATLLLVSQGRDGKEYEFSLGIAEERKVGEKSQTEELATFYANDFEELAKEYQAVKGKSLSLVHLKAILLTKEQRGVLEEQWDIISQMGEYEEIAKTCPVLQVGDKEAFLKFVKNAEEPVGTYISSLINAMERDGKSIPWLKDYLKILREEMDLQIYFLEKAEEGWCVKCRAEVTISDEE